MRSVGCSVVRTSLHNASLLVWTIFFCMRLVMALAFYMLRASLAQTSAVLALRYWSTFLVDMDEGTI
jgi:hypothetical protein